MLATDSLNIGFYETVKTCNEHKQQSRV